jgi:tetratricopeptide (TPR) repeat protein
MSACISSKKNLTESNDKSVKKELNEQEQLDFVFYFYNAEKEKLLGNYKNAADLLFQCLKIDPSSDASMYELADIYDITGNAKDALFLSKKAVKLQSKNKWYQLQLAALYQKTGDSKGAIQVYQQLVSEYPHYIEFYYQLASAQISSGNLEDAVKTFDLIESKTGISEDLCLQKERIYIKLGNVEKAVWEIQKLIQQNPHEAQYYGMLGELYMANDMTDKALEAYNKILEMEPNNPEIHLSLAEYYRNTGNKEKSFEEIVIAFSSHLMDIDTKIKILLSYYAITEKFEELKTQAFTLIDTLVAVHPQEPKAFSIQGDFLFRDHRLKEACTAYRNVITLDKSKFIIWNQLLIIESQLNDYESMYKESKDALELFPTQPTVYIFNGVACMQIKRYDEAVQILKNGVDILVDDPMLSAQFYSYLGDAYHELKNDSLSDVYYNKTLSIDSQNAYVLNNYSYYLSERGADLNKALEMSKKSNELEKNNASFLDTYGWILYKKGDFASAKTWLEKAFENGGEKSGTIIEHLGDVNYKLGDSSKALEYWKKAKESGEGSPLLDRKITDQKLYE